MNDKKKIPKGEYCYDEKGNCPYWEIRDDKPNQRNGYCKYLKRGDWQAKPGKKWPKGAPLSALSLLWDQVKECGMKIRA